ncbi:hypothetical protein [Streptomyces sp. NPDC002685]|uniref:hypothetical protein n=1 Tax=Streptomyces sp. NPDC002685 TaxID=3154540 RepID=UPI00332E7962
MARVSAEEREQAAVWLASGKSADWVAARFGVRAGTVRSWRRNDPVFKAAYERQLGGLQGQGLLAVAERRSELPRQLRRKPGASTLATLQEAALEIGRREARRGR